MTTLSIKNLSADDILTVVDAFKKSNWTEKPASLFEKYVEEQDKGERVVWVAYSDNKFAGYVTLKWQSFYKPFLQKSIPEIVDLNVLPEFRNQGIASSLLDKCEAMAATKSALVGIGVGLYPDYGAAQKLYVKRGYVPDGKGATYNYESVIPGEKYALDDDLVIWLSKNLLGK